MHTFPVNWFSLLFVVLTCDKTLRPLSFSVYSEVLIASIFSCLHMKHLYEKHKIRTNLLLLLKSHAHLLRTGLIHKEMGIHFDKSAALSWSQHVAFHQRSPRGSVSLSLLWKVTLSLSQCQVGALCRKHLSSILLHSSAAIILPKYH